MDIIDINTLFKAPPTILVILFLNALGWLLKQTPRINNEYIPAALAVTGSIIVCVFFGLSINSVVIGFIAGASSVGFHQVVKQYLDSKEGNKP